MDDNEKKLTVQNALVNYEFLPAIQGDTDVNAERFIKLPLGKLASVGTAFEPIATAIQTALGGAGGSGLYMVNTNGGQMFSSSGGFIGSIKAANGGVGGGQALLNPIAMNPTMLFMAIALYSIDKKLDAIKEAQKEILAFLEQKEKSKLKGDLVFLTDVLNNYKYNWNNDKFKTANHIKVLDIKQSSEQSILFYQKQIIEKMKSKAFFHGDKDVKAKLIKVDSDFEGYQLAVYLHAFSSFLEVMLLENFDSGYLNAVREKVNDNALEYRELYSTCYNQIEQYSQSSLESHFVRGLSAISNSAGKTMAKVPVVNKSQIDDALIESSNRLKKLNSQRTSHAMKPLMKHQDSSIRQFADNIDIVNWLYNEPLEMLVDNENIYFALPEKSGN